MDIQALIAQLNELIKKLNTRQKIIIASTIVAVIALVIFLALFNASAKKADDGYKVMFENISPKDAGLIVAELDKQKVPYKIPRDGVIEVPEEKVNKLRLDVAAMGLPKDSRVGFELFDKQEFGSTDFDQQVKYNRALEGELSKTIESINAVQRAAVHIARPKESVFAEKDTPPTASVVVTLKPNMILTPKQIMGVKNLVSAGVTKLTPENVKLVNENGDLLGSDDEESMAGEAAKQQMKYKKDFEKLYEEKINNMLAPVVGGNDRVVAKVTIEFDFAKKETTSESYDPNSVVRSEQTSEEKREGFKQPEIGGVPGAVSNIGPVQGIESGNTTEKYSKSTGTTNYEISKTVSNVKGEYAAIKRITAAVVVDGKYAKDEQKNEIKYTPLDTAELDKISGLVRQSIGYDQKRGDEISVSNFRFNNNTAGPTGVKGIMQEYGFIIGPALDGLKYVAAAVILFILYNKVIAPFAERMMEIPVEEAAQKPKEFIFDEEELEDTHGKLAEMRKRVEQQLGIAGPLNEESLKYDVLLEKIKTAAEEHSEDVAKLIETLIVDETTAAAGGLGAMKKEL
ncbi:MAG: flagellar basal-body MS-ring/collar protein FliF [Campylobacterales bacterium]|nr:flagellar basal-body MS-ring/collar protein FliF [Campylobacterales bacterium]